MGEVSVQALFLLAAERSDSPIEWGSVADWSAAFGAMIAAFAALYIATSDRRERRYEQMAASREQATLVIVKVDQPQGSEGYFPVTVSNYGAQAVLDLAFDAASYDHQPMAAAEVDEARRQTGVLDSDRLPYSFFVVFVDANASPILAAGEPDDYGHVAVAPVDLTAVHVWVRFRDADGIAWRRSSTGGIERLGLTA